MIAGADILIHAEPRRLDPAAFLDRLGRQRFFPALLVQHAFARGDDDLWPRRIGCQRLAQHVAHMSHVIGAVHLTDPVDADAAAAPW